MLKLILSTLITSQLCFGLTLKDRFDHAAIGDYLVTEQDRNFCLLFVRELNQDVLIIDEMTFHEKDLPKNFNTWRHADFKGAYPLSWVSFQFDRKTGSLEEAYSFHEKTWLEFKEEDIFLKGLLNLEMTQLDDRERKKIGPTPTSGEPDLRKSWNPPLTLSGTKYTKPSYEVFKGRWPHDATLLSKCHIEMYFSKNDSSLPFPTWIEINNGHIAFKLKGVDAGHDFNVNNIRQLPKKPLLIASGFEYKSDLVVIKIKAPRLSRNFELFAECPSTKKQVRIDYKLTSCGEKDLFYLTLPIKTLAKVLEKSKSYHLVFYPEKNPNFFIRTQDVFICP